MSAETTNIKGLIVEHLDQPVNPAIQHFAEHLAKRPGVLAILFYGNFLRDPEAQGLIDLYVLTESNQRYHGFGISACFNRLLPPNVYFEEWGTGSDKIQAKIAVMTLSAFHKKMRPQNLDTTLWARFSQPAILIYSRDQFIRQRVIEAILSAYDTAFIWASRLHPRAKSAKSLWTNLFSQTYQVELRVESSKRADQIVENQPLLYSALFEQSNLTISSAHIAMYQRQWDKRRLCGKSLNIMRLIKAAFTFKGGFAYAIQKVEKHSGRPVILKAWERRFPWLAAPFVFIRFLRDKRLR